MIPSPDVPDIVLTCVTDPDAPHPRLFAGDQEQAERDDAERVAGADGAGRVHRLRFSGVARRHTGEILSTSAYSYTGNGQRR